MAPDDELDDLLSSLDPDEFEDRPGTELLTPPPAFGPASSEVSDSLPPIRTPLPPAPLEVPLEPPPETPPRSAAAAPPEPFSAPVPEPPRAAPPLTLDPNEELQGVTIRPPAKPPNQPPKPAVNLSAADDLAAAFELAEAESLGGRAELQAAADAAAAMEFEPEPARPLPASEPLIEPEPSVDADLGPAVPRSASARRGLPTIVWVAIISFAVAALGGILFSQIDAFHPERQVTRDQLSEGEKERALEAHRRAQPVPGNVTITSSEPDAAVWLLLGRTPLQSITLPSEQVHEVRFELPGRKTLDATVDRTHWNGTQASLSVELSKGSRAMPAYPPEQSVKPPPGPKGRGELLLESQPAGARAWLLIGFTPDVKLTGIETGRRYEFRLAKDGFLPGYAVVEETDWSAGRTEAARSVVLAPAKTARK